MDVSLYRIADGDVSGTTSGKAKGKGGSWFEALAAALGGMLGQRVGKLLDDMQTMKDNYAATLAKDPTAAQKDQASQYMAAMTDFQVQSQIFGMESQTSATAIKSIGDGLTDIARKQ
jgi:hypothetical protein